MTRGRMRRGQLVAPFGVGAITVMPDGTAIIIAGLDHWFRTPDGSSSAVDLEEFSVEEWRLEDALGVSHFRLPPDFRTVRLANPEQTNLRLTIPALRFPRWHFCPRCRSLRRLPLSFSGLRRCEYCKQKGRRSPVMAQVPFVAMCEAGHLQDFPFREWVHKSIVPDCGETMKLIATGAASMGAQRVQCKCGKYRTLARITEASTSADMRQSSFLTTGLTDGDSEYVCRGSTPWNGSDEGEGCGFHLRGSLRAASNLYFALTRSSIYLPRTIEGVSEELLELLTRPPLSTVLEVARKLSGQLTPSTLRDLQHGHLLKPYGDGQVEKALAVLSDESKSKELKQSSVSDTVGDWTTEKELAFRKDEFMVLRDEINSVELKVRTSDQDRYDPTVASVLARVTLVDQLRETRVFWGFNRVYPDGGDFRDRRRLLWKSEPDKSHSWLPAYIVRGEGIFLEFDRERLLEWESRSVVLQRVSAMQSRFEIVKSNRGLRDRVLTPRYVMLHTFAHLLMNRLTYECGYSSASLRERLYVADTPDPVAALLIYTAAGDSEGTMGGLVRMGKPGYLEPSIRAALAGASWCSSDPVCMELGESGQGPDSCNLAACHSCALVPETACEEFNRFLDRGLVVGTLDNPELGFFSALLKSPPSG